MPKNLNVVDVLPKNESVVDVLSRNKAIEDTLPKMSTLGAEQTRSFDVVLGAGYLITTVPLLTYSTTGTATWWAEGRDIVW